MHWHSPLGGEVLGQAATNSRLEGGQMSLADSVTAPCNKCCWVRYSWRLQFYNHPKQDTSQRSTTSFNAYFALFYWAWLEIFNKLGK